MDAASAFCYVPEDDHDDQLVLDDTMLGVAPLAALSAPSSAKRLSSTHTLRRNRGAGGGRVHRHQVDTNVLSIKLDKLAQGAAVATGEPTFCTKCRGCLSAVSRLVDHTGTVVRAGGPQHGGATAAGAGPEECQRTAAAGSAGDESKTSGAGDAGAGADAGADEARALEEGELLWQCEFCGTNNVVAMDAEEVPTEGSYDYMLAPAPEAPAGSAAPSEDGGVVVFCVDTSGSMCVTTEVAGRHLLRGDRSADMQNMTMAGDARDQRFPGQRRNVTYVSRLQSVATAVAAQIEALKRDHPHKRVALVSFSDDVVISGDCTVEPRHLAGTRLDMFDELSEIGATFPLDGVVGDTCAVLTSKVEALREGGATALGPALLVSLQMAARQRGSKVVVCTDGLANVGLGCVDDASDAGAAAANKFYARIGEMAADKGVTIDVIGIEGEGCDVETLSLAVEPSGGEITKVKPAEVTRDMAAMMAAAPVATQVSATLFLHAALRFRNVAEDDVSMSGNRLMRAVGNVTAGSEITFEYGAMPAAERRAAGFGRIDHMPFQCQIHYTRLDGSKYVRVISQSKPVTSDRSAAEAQATPAVLAAHAAQQSAHMARRGSYTKSRMNMAGYGVIMQRCARSTGRAADADTVRQFAAQMTPLDSLLESEMQSEAKRGDLLDESLDTMAASGAVEERMHRQVARCKARKKNDRLSNAIFKAKRSNAASMSAAPRPAASGAPAASAAPAAAMSAPKRRTAKPHARRNRGKRNVVLAAGQ